ncbi:MAG TPA: DUF4476 domain-containing protein [Chitinophagaceae bacterium]|nr:DUF4476 domain-containing protein [Chitinophagaceae bacterium]
MKTISTLFASLYLSGAVFAGDLPPSGTLSIRSQAEGTIRVIVDGKSFAPYNNALVIQQVNPGYHQVTVYNNRNEADFGFRRGSDELLYQGSLAVRPMTQVSLSIDCRGQASLTEQALPDRMDDGFRQDRDHGHGGRGDRDDDPARYGYGSRSGQDDYGQGGYSQPGVLGYPDREDNYSQVLSDRDFGLVLQSLQNEWVESNRLRSAAYLVGSRYFTSRQISELVSLFESEGNRLSLAEQAYPQAVDPRDYGCVFQALDTQFGRAQLAQYIRDCR